MLGAVMYFLIWIVLQPLRFVLRWQVRGLEHLPPRPQGVVLTINHLHWLDILLLGASMPLRYRPWWIAKVELFERGWLAWWFRKMQVIPIARGKRDMSAMHAAEDALRNGAVLVIFAEGHRSKSGALQEGRGGGVRLAARTGVPIMPAAIIGTEAGLGRILLRRSPIEIAFGPCYHPDVPGDSIPYNRMGELVDEMMLAIARLLPAERWGHYAAKMQPALHANTQVTAPAPTTET